MTYNLEQREHEATSWSIVNINWTLQFTIECIKTNSHKSSAQVAKRNVDKSYTAGLLISFLEHAVYW